MPPKPPLNIDLAPPAYLSIRLTILGCLLVPLLFIPGMEWWARILSSIMPLIFTGTFRISRIIETRFETRFYFGFVPFPLQKCKLATVGMIQTTYVSNQPGIWTLLLFGPLQFISGWIFNFLLPSFGGPLEIWLITAKGREIKAWQGHNQDYFDTNLKLLLSHTTAELQTRVGA